MSTFKVVVTIVPNDAAAAAPNHQTETVSVLIFGGTLAKAGGLASDLVKSARSSMKAIALDVRPFDLKAFGLDYVTLAPPEGK